MALDDNGRKELYRKLLNDPATSAGTKKYSFTQWERKIAESPNALAKIGAYAISKKWANDLEDFSNRYGAGAKPYTPPPAPKPQAAPVAPVPIEQEPYVPEPQPAIGSPEYDAQLQAQYGGMSPTLGATFGGVPAAFETKAQKKQEQISPVFKAQQLAFEDVPIASEQRRAQREFAKATKEQQQAAIMGGTGVELEQEKKAKERGKLQYAGDIIGSWADSGNRLAKSMLSTIGYFAQTQAATDPMANLPYEKREEMMQGAAQTMYDNATAAQNTFQNEIAKRNIQTSVLQAINKGQYSRIPESVLYTIGDAAMQIIPSIFTFGGSTYMQTLPQVYKDGVDAIAKEKGISPEQVVASGEDAFLVSQINAGLQSALEFMGAGLVSKSIASRGAYKAMRDYLLKQNVNRSLARGASLLGVGLGEAATEYGQETTGQIGKTAAKSPTAKAFFDKLPNELFTPEARNQRAESFVGGLVGGLALAGGGQAVQSAMDRTLFEAPKIGKATQRADMDIVQTDNKIQERNKIQQAMEEAVKANPEAEGQIRQQYQKRIDAAAPTNEEVLTAYESTAQLPESEEKAKIQQNLEAYMAEKGIQPEPVGQEAGLGELMRMEAPEETPVIQTVNPEFPAPQLTPEEAVQEDEDLAALNEQIAAIEGAPVEEEVVAEEVPATSIAPLNIDFSKNEGRNVNYQGVEGRIKIDSDGVPYVFTKDGDVVYIEGGLSGQTPQQLGVQPLPDDVISETDIETVLQDENAPLDQGQLEYDFDNNSITLYGKPFTYEGVEVNSKGQTTALRLKDANGKTKYVRNEDTILEFEIQKELYEKSKSNKPLTVESAIQAAEQLQVSPIARPEQVPQPIQQERPAGDIEEYEVRPIEEEVVTEQVPPIAPKAKKEKAPKPAPVTPPAVSETPALRDVESTAKALEGKNKKDAHGLTNWSLDKSKRLKELQDKEDSNNLSIDEQKEFDKLMTEFDLVDVDLLPKEHENALGFLFDVPHSKNTPKAISEAYHKAKSDGSNPELVKAVEELLKPKAVEGAEVGKAGIVAENPALRDVESTAKVIEDGDKWYKAEKSVKDKDGNDITLTIDKNKDTNHFYIKAKDNKGNEIGSALFETDNGKVWSGNEIEVNEGNRRKGIMSAIYDFAESEGHPLEPTKSLSKEGKAFWENRKSESLLSKEQTPPAAPKAQPVAEKKEEKPTTGVPEEGSRTELPPQSKYSTTPRKMVFKDGEWKQNVGGQFVSVGEPVQKQAQEAFSGKKEAKAEETKPAPKAPETKGGEEGGMESNITNSALKEMGVEIKKDKTREGFYKVYKDKIFVGLLGATSFEQAKNKGQYFEEGLMSDILSKMGIEHSKPIKSIAGENEFITIRIKNAKALEKSLFSQETKQTASFTSKQEGNASTEFDGIKKPSKIKTKSFDNKYGKGAFERMQNITQNFEDIMDGLSEKIKQDCL